MRTCHTNPLLQEINGAKFGGGVPPAPLGHFTVRISESSRLETAFLPECVRSCSLLGWTLESPAFRVSAWSLLVTWSRPDSGSVFLVHTLSRLLQLLPSRAAFVAATSSGCPAASSVSSCQLKYGHFSTVEFSGFAQYL